MASVGRRRFLLENGKNPIEAVASQWRILSAGGQNDTQDEDDRLAISASKCEGQTGINED